MPQNKDSGLDLPLIERVLREEVHRREVIRFLKCLQNNGISVLVMKGTALAYSKYSEPSDRPRLDTDIWIHPLNVMKAKTALLSAGFHYHRTNHGTLVHTQMIFFSQDSSGHKHYFDLHWQPFNPVLLRDLLSFEEVWKASEELLLQDFTCRRPSDLHQILLSAVHWAGHHFLSPSPIWLLDLKLLSENKDPDWWRNLVQLLSDKQIGLLGGRILEHCQTQGILSPPAFVIPALLEKGPKEKSQYFLRPDRNRIRDLMFDLHCLPTMRLRLQLLKEHFFPSSEYLQGSSRILRIFRGLRKLRSLTRP